MATESPFDIARSTLPLNSTARQSQRDGSGPRFLLIRRRYLGDIVLLGSVIRNIRLQWPAATVTVGTEAAYSGVIPLNPEINAALVLPRRAMEWPAFLRALRRGRFTHVLDFDNTEKTALITALSGASLRATFNRELIPFRYGWMYNHTANVTNAFYDSHHITETYLALAEAAGVPLVSREVKLVPRAEDLRAAERLVGVRQVTAGNHPFRLLVHPGSRSPSRVWPVEHYATVCDRLQDLLGVQVFLTAGPAEQPLLDAIRGHAKTHLVSINSVANVGALAALTAQFNVFLCHDSGPMHVAAAVGTPVVALFGSQNATIWRPLGPSNVVLQTKLPCPCIGDAAPTPCVREDSYRSHCVRMLSENDVFAAVAGRLT